MTDPTTLTGDQDTEEQNKARGWADKQGKLSRADTQKFAGSDPGLVSSYESYLAAVSTSPENGGRIPVWKIADITKFISEDVQRAMNEVKDAADQVIAYGKLVSSLAELIAKIARGNASILETLINAIRDEIKKILDDLFAVGAVYAAPILIAHDAWTQYQVPGRIDAAQAASTDSGALFGLFRAAGALPDLGFIDRMSISTLQSYQLVVWRHPGYIGQETLGRLQTYVAGGGVLVVIGDINGEVKTVVNGDGQVVRLIDNPAAGWNGDDFPRLGSAAVASLKLAKEILAKAKILPMVSVSAEGQEPFVQAWMQTITGEERTLLYVENFTRELKTVKLSLVDQALPARGEKLRLTQRISGTTAAAEPVIVSRTTLTTVGVRLPLSVDGVDIWDITVAM
jgi:hypothetical protein